MIQVWPILPEMGFLGAAPHFLPKSPVWEDEPLKSLTGTAWAKWSKLTWATRRRVGGRDPWGHVTRRTLDPVSFLPKARQSKIIMRKAFVCGQNSAKYLKTILVMNNKGSPRNGHSHAEPRATGDRGSHGVLGGSWGRKRTHGKHSGNTTKLQTLVHDICSRALSDVPTVDDDRRRWASATPSTHPAYLKLFGIKS